MKVLSASQRRRDSALVIFSPPYCTNSAPARISPVANAPNPCTDDGRVTNGNGNGEDVIVGGGGMKTFGGAAAAPYRRRSPGLRFIQRFYDGAFEGERVDAAQLAVDDFAVGRDQYGERHSAGPSRVESVD